jgi:hypothetical protein
MYNFGSLLDTLKEFVVDSVVNKTPYDKKRLGSILRLIKENRILYTQFKVFENVRTHHAEDDFVISEFISETVKQLDGISRKDIVKTNRLFKEALDVLTNKTELVESTTINTAVSKLIFSNDVKERAAVKGSIKEHIKNNIIEKPATSDYVPTDMLAKVLVDRFNKKYADLSESDITLVKSLMSDNKETQETEFNSIIKECLTKVNSQISESDTNVKEKLLLVKERLLDMGFNPKTYEEDMLKMINLKDSLN